MSNPPTDPVSGGRSGPTERRSLERIVTADQGAPGEKIERILELAADRLDVALGLLVRVEDGGRICSVVASNGRQERLTDGATGDLLYGYCRRTQEASAPFVVRNDLDGSPDGEATFSTSEIGIFFGVGVATEEGPYGTVCFVDREAGDCSVSEETRSLLEQVAESVGAILQEGGFPAEHPEDAELSGEVDGRPVLRESSFIIAEVDQDLRYKWVYDPHAEIDPDRVIGKRDDELGSGPGVDEIMELKRRAFEDGEQVRQEIVLEHRGGLHVYDVIATPLREGDGREVTGLITASLNITARREQERTYRESEVRYRALAENFPSGAVGVYDRDLRYTLAAGTLLGESLPAADQLEGRRMPDVFPEETVQDIEPIFRRAVAEGTAGSVETTFGGRDWKVWATPLRDAGGEVFAGLSCAQDITGQKEREATLRKQRNLLEQAQRLAGAWELDVRTGDAVWSETVYDIHELPRGVEMDLDQALSFYPPEARFTVREAFERCLHDGTAYDLEVPIVTAKDNERWVRAVGAPAEIEDGTVVKVAGAFQDITDQKREERRRRDVIHRVTDAIVEVDTEWNITLVNDQAEALYGMSEDDLLGKWFWDVFSTALGTRFETTYRRVMRTREAESLVEYYSSLDGWFDIHAYPNADGGLAFYFQEVTDQKEKEAVLRRHRNLLQQTQRLAGAWEADLETGDLSWSEEVYRIHEVPPRTSMTVEEGLSFYAPDARSELRDLWDRCVDQGIPYDVELPIMTAKGHRRWVRSVGARVDDDGRTIAGAVQDITERKTVERELRQKEERLRDLANTVPGVIVQFFARPDGTYGNHFISEQAEHILGISSDPSTFFERFLERIPESHVDDLRTSIEEAVQEGRPWRHEMPFIKPSGERIWLLGTTTPRQRERELVYNGVLLDITEQKEAENQLRDAKETAEEAARLKAAMLANVSHEVRTPLTSILGFAETISGVTEAIEEEGATEANVHALARSSALITKSGRRLLDTLDSVLNLSKLEAGTLKLSREPVELTEVIEEVLQMFIPQAEEAGVDLRGDIRGLSVVADADSNGVFIVLRNLVSNAVKYTNSGGTVLVRAREEAETVVVEVEDTGVGMEPGLVTDLFEAFRQESEGLAREYEGAGLGLAVTKEAVDQMHGQIEVETEKGVGSRFTVRFPRPRTQG